MKIFQIIHLASDSERKKQRLMDQLLIHNVVCFGIGPKIVVVDDHPAGRKDVPKLTSLLRQPDLRKVMRNCSARRLTFDDSVMQKLRPDLSKAYVLKRRTANTVTYHSKTQSAIFTIERNGRLKTSKDLLDVDLIVNLVRILNNEKPLSLQE